MYDIIGDIHGYAEELGALLDALGYAPSGRGYRAPVGRQLVFLGDLIDRGPAQIRVLEIARAMVDSGDALCIMGNHEFNAISYATEDPGYPGECFRPNRSDSAKSVKNRAQHVDFLKQVGGGTKEHMDWVRWFRTLPPFINLGGLRVVHGCWDGDAIATLMAGGWGPGAALTDELLAEVNRKGSPMMAARKLLTCGMELDLPDGRFILDKSGQPHFEVRIANWRDWASQLHEVALVPPGQEEQLENMDWPADLVISKIEGPPIFVGHYWFSGHPVVESPKLACLDWSVAKGGKLVAYRWDGESGLTNDKLVWVGQ